MNVTSRSFPHSWLITGFVPRLTQRVSLVEQELLTLPEHLSSPPVLVYIEEKQTTLWPKEKVQKDKQRSTKHTHKTKDRVTPNPQKNREWTQKPSPNLVEQWSLWTSSPKSWTNDTKIVLYWSKSLVSQRNSKDGCNNETWCCICCFVCLCS